MNADEKVIRWAENKLKEHGRSAYLEDENYRVVGASFGHASYYPAILIDIEKRVHHKDGSISWRKWECSPIELEIYDDFSPICFYAELDDME